MRKKRNLNIQNIQEKIPEKSPVSQLNKWHTILSYRLMSCYSYVIREEESKKLYDDK
jgi:hypothetical protein